MTRREAIAECIFTAGVLTLLAWVAWYAFLHRQGLFALFFTTMFVVLAALASPAVTSRYYPDKNEGGSHVNVRHRSRYNPRRL